MNHKMILNIGALVLFCFWIYLQIRKKDSVWKKMMTIGITLAAILAALVSMLYFFLPRILYFSFRQLEATPTETDSMVRTVYPCYDELKNGNSLHFKHPFRY